MNCHNIILEQLNTEKGTEKKKKYGQLFTVGRYYAVPYDSLDHQTILPCVKLLKSEQCLNKIFTFPYLY